MRALILAILFTSSIGMGCPMCDKKTPIFDMNMVKAKKEARERAAKAQQEADKAAAKSENTEPKAQPRSRIRVIKDIY